MTPDNAGLKMIEVSEDELRELRLLETANKAKKVKSTARSSARQELIKRHQGEYDGLVKKHGGGS